MSTKTIFITALAAILLPLRCERLVRCLPPLALLYSRTEWTR
ncbi:MAG: hypothetical protein ACOYM3_18695 [Terrimicrobiaceae bacterium]